MICQEEQIDSVFLTNILAHCNVNLQSNHIVNIEKNVIGSEGSLTYLYNLLYMQKDENLPSSIYIKFDKIRATNHYKRLTRNEIDFYQKIQPACNEFTVPMYDSDYQQDFSYLILQDYSKTHYVPSYEMEIKYYEVALRRIAEFHSFCSNQKISLLKDKKHSPMDYNQVDLDTIKENNCKFCGYLDGVLTHAMQSLLSDAIHIIENQFVSINQYLETHQNTIVHGDYHLKNCLFSKDDNSKDMRILDWQWWNYGIGTYDVAHLLNLYLPNELKTEELSLMKIYYDTISSLGSHLSWEEYIYQYRLFTILNLFKPAQYAIYCKLRRKKIFWKELLDKIIVSYKRLQ